MSKKLPCRTYILPGIIQELLYLDMMAHRLSEKNMLILLLWQTISVNKRSCRNKLLLLLGSKDLPHPPLVSMILIMGHMLLVVLMRRLHKSQVRMSKKSICRTYLLSGIIQQLLCLCKMDMIAHGPSTRNMSLSFCYGKQFP
jgi:hypothetical protein